ncbi:hypothetical protein BH09BAC2_BH09BAC2_19020 [soil metagenome]
MPGKDYYQILEVTSAATFAEIKASYRRLAKLYHPDKNNGNELQEEKFKELNEAYAVLSDEHRRKRYDEYFSDLDFEEMERIRTEYIKSKQQAYDKKKKILKKQQEEAERNNKKGYVIVAVVMIFVSLMIGYSLHLRNISKARDEQINAMLPVTDSGPAALNKGDSNYNLKIKDHKVFADLGNGVWLELMNTNFDKIVAGAWQGTLADASSRKLRTIIFFSDPRNNIYDVDYPSAGCSGTWNIRNVSEKTLTFSEILETGKAGCDQAVKITFQEVAEKKLLMRFYFPDSVTIAATAVLKKDLPK